MLKNITIPQISGFWKGLFYCVVGSILMEIVQHPSFHSWIEVGPFFSAALLDSLKIAAGWILMQSPFKPSKDEPKSN